MFYDMMLRYCDNNDYQNVYIINLFGCFVSMICVVSTLHDSFHLFLLSECVLEALCVDDALLVVE